MAILAQELLATCAIFAILDNICAIALRTVEDYCLAYHVPVISSFRMSHYRNLEVRGYLPISLDHNQIPRDPITLAVYGGIGEVDHLQEL